MHVYAGIDVGSTTVKMMVIDQEKNELYSCYERHFSDVKKATKKMIRAALEEIGDQEVALTITGSGGIGLAESCELAFIQEVIACTRTVEELIPQTDVVIELGGEDAKITFFEGSLEQRMNGTCAGGTGAFIDQMASLLDTDASGLNELAKHATTIYPIASRCGVFAKTDIQPLLNEGAAKEDIAKSIFQAVVNQTIAGLASGRKIKGNVAFLGGPLYFLSELRQRFIDTLALSMDQVIYPEQSQLFVAYGAALYAQEENQTMRLSEFIDKLETNPQSAKQSDTLAPLFVDEAAREAFVARHEKATVKERELDTYEGRAFLGIDAGSTTTKVALIDEQGALLYSWYGSNEGQPLETTIAILTELYQQLPTAVTIAKAAVTGYGEHLIKHALKVDIGEVETMAHYQAANFFLPGVDFILDIGGQDMKAMTIKDGALSAIQLNEACSSGCGSFIETFAKSLHYPLEEFVQGAIVAAHPVDLGSRCTVFMNSKVKQVQKEGASVGDIAAGLAYSVIKNAIYKVIKVRRPEQLGERIVCQGGTFYNDAVLRAFELVTGRTVIRPNIAGLMGAFGAALIAKDAYQEGEHTTLLAANELATFEATKELTHCGLCENNCLLTITLFSDGRQFITGNRCERGARIKIKREDRKANLYDYKLKRIFKYRSLRKKEAIRGEIGLPRVLNMYENYPLWHTFFTDLGFRVVLSPHSTKECYEKGIDTIPSDTVCYPAKLVHGHIQTLIEQQVPIIFYPSIIFEQNEGQAADNHFNCPIVQSYPDLIRMNVEEIRSGSVDYRNPFLNLADKSSMIATLTATFADLQLSRGDITKALQHGFTELAAAKQDIQTKGEETIAMLMQTNQNGIVLSGRPYHLDPEINHGIAEVLTQEGFHVLTEDSLAHLAEVKSLRVVNQWMYHSRLYAAAHVVAKCPQLEMVQLNSFGCGIDAVTTDQVAEIMEQAGKLYTVLKIDEGANLGAVRIRVRSLKAALRAREKTTHTPTHTANLPEKIVFTKDMRKKHTLLMPMLSPIHQNGLFDLAMQASGYHIVGLPADDSVIDTGLQYVNNDACYPAIISIGQLIKALQSGEYDLDNVSVLMSQTGGGCRATNYIPLLRKALKEAGFENVPVVSLSFGNQGVETNPGFTYSYKMIKRVLLAVLYGDLFERLVYRVRPYEVKSGSTDQLHQAWLENVATNVQNGSLTQFNRTIKKIIHDFDELPIYDYQKPKVGVVGEILVKYSPIANNNIVRLLESEGAEVVVPDILGFMNYSLYNQIWKEEHLGMSVKSKRTAQVLLKLVSVVEQPLNRALKDSTRFCPSAPIEELATKASRVLSIGNQTGEGWFLTAEMIELLDEEVDNIVCLQPFGCLPNHIVGKGVLKELRARYPQANIAPIDYDPGVSIVNQLNRIRLMLSTAKKRVQS